MSTHSLLPAKLQALREACQLSEDTIYLANCSQGPQSLPVRAAAETFLQDWARTGPHWDTWIGEVERARAAFASLIGAEPSSIAVGSSVSQLVSSLASALVTSPRRMPHRLVTSDVDFPGVAHAWLALRRAGWTVEVVAHNERAMVDTSSLLAALDELTAVLSVPHVCYAHGAMMDLQALVAAAHAQGTLVFVDAYQSLGTVPLDVAASGVDFLVSGTLKYLLGTAGIAFLYVKPALLEALEPTVTGWFGRHDPFAFDPRRLDYPARAARFDLGTPPIFNAYVARAGMELVMQTGVDRIWEQIQALSALAYDFAPRLRLPLAGPKEGELKGATTAIDAGTRERAHWLEQILARRSIKVAARDRFLRLAPHGFTTTDEWTRAFSTVSALLQGDVEGRNEEA